MVSPALLLSSFLASHTASFRTRLSLLVILLLLSFFSVAQDSLQVIPADTTLPIPVPDNTATVARTDTAPAIPTPFKLSPVQVKRRVWTIAAANIAGYGGAMIVLNAAWYKGYPRSKLHSFNDFPEWQQVDKVGHLYSAYIESRASMELWRWTGIDRKKRIWLGGMSGAFYQTVIEVLDGYSAQWGWSWGDFGANILGSSMLVAQELAWNEQRIKLKFSFHRKSYDDPSLNQRSDQLFGKSTGERFLKDYNGQTYWFSTGLRNLFPRSKMPAWLQLSVGTGADGMFGANDNVKTDDNNQVVFDRRDIKRYRQWYLAPDIDLSKIKTRKKGVKMMLRLLNSIKIPAPGLSYGNGKLRWHWLLF